MSNSQSTLPIHPLQQLNYHARKKGRHSKPYKYQTSPLYQQQPNTITVTSRRRTPSNTSSPESLSNSIIWLNQITAQDSDKILIVEGEQQQEMLILDSSEYSQFANTEDLRKQSPQKSDNKKIGYSERKSILICEQSEDLLWINNQQYCELNSPYIQHSPNNNISNVQHIKTNQLHPDHRQCHRMQLSNIQEMQSQAEEDQDYIMQQQCLGRAPISPQSQPLIKLKPVINHTTSNTIINKKIIIKEQEFVNGEKQKEGLFGNRRFNFDDTTIKEALSQPKSSIFRQQLKQLQQLEQTHQQNRDTIKQIILILQHQQQYLQNKINKQDSFLLQLKTSINLKQPITHHKHIDSDLSQQAQIRHNMNLIRRVVALPSRH